MTDMDVPLGRAVGNWPEIREAIECLRGEHAESTLMQVVRGLAGEMIALGGAAASPEEGREKARKAVESGAAWACFRRLMEAQGGDLSVIEAPESRLDSAAVAEVEVPAGTSGYVADLDALSIGQAAVELGAGRQTKEESVDPVAGLTDLKKPGDAVAEGDVLARLHSSESPDLEAVRSAVQEAYRFTEAPPSTAAAVKARYDAGGWTDLAGNFHDEV
jgi:pyrimidine-nucleoside phosphorylase